MDYSTDLENDETDEFSQQFFQENSLSQGNLYLQENISNQAFEHNEGDPITLFAVQLTVFVRSFKGQTSGKSIGVWELHVSSVEEFKSSLWNEVKPHVKREIIMENNELKWHDNQEPMEADLKKFVLFYDKISKRCLEVDSVNTTILQHWVNRCVYLYIHEYSWFISSKSMFQTVQKSLIQPVERDRAGAAAQIVVVDITKQLKERHKNNFKASDICWYQWANKILSSDAHCRDDMINDAPPAELIHLFKPADVADNQLLRVQRGVILAQNVNDGIAADWKVLRETVELMEPQINQLVDLFASLKARVTMVENHLEHNETLLSAMEEAMSPEENALSVSLERQIDDQLDVDHT